MHNIQAVIDILNEDFDANISAEYYAHVEQWRQWWEGRVNSFHTYRETQYDGQRIDRQLYSMRMAKKICEDWASLLLNEKTKIVADDNTTQAFLDDVFENIEFWPEANSLVEKAFYSGTGAFVMKLDGLTASDAGRIQESPAANIRMEYLPAFCIVPLSQLYGRITEAAFASERVERGKRFVYVEIHTRGTDGYVIENRYYDAENDSLRRVELPTGIIERLETSSPIPFFSILRPNIVNTYRDNLGLGCSVFAHAIDNLKGVDLAFNNFCRDFRLGGKKVFYNRELIKTLDVTGNGAMERLTPDDVMQQLFMSVGDENIDNDQLIYEFNPALRVRDNMDGVQGQLDYLSFKCGMGARHYRFDDTRKNAITATQYTGEKQDLKQNAAKHSIIADKALRSITRAMIWAGKNILGQPVNPDTDIKVEFSDGYIISDEERREVDRKDLLDRVLLPAEYRVKWYGETMEEARAALAKGRPDVIFGSA